MPSVFNARSSQVEYGLSMSANYSRRCGEACLTQNLEALMILRSMTNFTRTCANREAQMATTGNLHPAIAGGAMRVRSQKC